MLIRMIYNIIWWLPIALTLLGPMPYQTGFILFALVTAFRLTANVYLNNAVEPERFTSFPFRA